MLAAAHRGPGSSPGNWSQRTSSRTPASRSSGRSIRCALQRIPPCSGPIPGTSCGPLTRVGAQSFSSVVGPNGSGKSNVIDAVLFVFAKRAKQIRMNKVCACRRPVRVAPSPRSCLQVSELIHKSDEHRDYDFAKVDVHFAEVVDGVRLPIPLPARTGVRH